MTERNIYNYNKNTDRKIAGIIRWLERFQNSYNSGAMESALMDAECARADLEDLRKDVWSSVGNVKNKGQVFFKFASCLCVIISAVILIMLTAAPVSRDRIFAQNFSANNLDNLYKIEKVEKTEKIENRIEVKTENKDENAEKIKIENNLKNNVAKSVVRTDNLKKDLKAENLNNKNVKGAKSVRPFKAEKNIKRAEKIEKSGKLIKVEKAENVKKAEKIEKIEKAEKAENTEKIVPYDKMFSLFQTGERALRNTTPVIEIK